MSEGVLIGVSSGALKIDSCAFTNVLGGDPLLPHGLPPPSCRLCGCSMAFLFRIDAPVGDSPFSRLLFAFMCASLPCLRDDLKSCFRLLRANVSVPDWRRDPAPDEAAGDLALDSWQIDGADDWGEEEMDTSDSAWPTDIPNGARPTDIPNGASARIAAVTTSSSFSFASMGRADFAGTYLDVYDEPAVGGDKSPSLTPHERALLGSYFVTADVDSALRELYRAAAAGEVDPDEAVLAEEDGEAPDDRLFSKFVRRLTACPLQVLRYSWAGRPLLAAGIAAAEAERVAKCAACGGPAVFELQTAPGLFHQLRAATSELQDVLCSLSVATVLVFSCEASCWGEGWREERCLVQLEPALQKLEELEPGED